MQAQVETDSEEISSVFSSPFLSGLAERSTDTPMEPIELPPADTTTASEDAPDAPVLMIACTVCEAVFKSKRSLATHMRKHGPQPVSSERPFACMFCSMTFTRASSMKKHMERAHRTPDTESLYVSSEPVAEPAPMTEFSFEHPVSQVTATNAAENSAHDATPQEPDVPMGEEDHPPNPCSIPSMTPMQFDLSSLDMELERPPSMHEQMLMLRAQNDQLITQNELLTTQLNRFFDFFMHRNQ